MAKTAQKYLAIVVGGTTLDWFNNTTPIPDVVKLIDKPMTREKAATEMFATLEDAIVNCNARSIDGELFYVDDDPDSDKIALNIYTTVESPEAIRDGLIIGDDIGVYAECVCHLD